MLLKSFVQFCENMFASVPIPAIPAYLKNAHLKLQYAAHAASRAALHPTCEGSDAFKL